MVAKGILWATLQRESIEELQGKIELPLNLVPAKHFHVTLRFGVEREKYEGLVGVKVAVLVDRVCFNSNVIAIPVNLLRTGLSSQNLNPHITWALAEGISPVESNCMLSGEHSTTYLTSPVLVQLEVEFLQWNSQ